jgi:hypothetical protein
MAGQMKPRYNLGYPLVRRGSGHMKGTVATLALLLVASSAQPAEIYECVAIGGGDFYSTKRCSDHNAIPRTIHRVPDNMTFDQQVDLINTRRREEQDRTRAQTDLASKRRECQSISDAIRGLDEKYAKGNYVEINEVNRDQRNRRDLRSRQASLGC